MTTWKAWVLVAVALLAAVGAGFALTANSYLSLVGMAFVLAAGTIGAIVQFGNPFLGLAVLVVTAIAFPVEFRGPAGVLMSSSFPLAAAICGIWLLRIALLRQSGLGGARVVYAVLAFITVTLLSFLAGQFPWYPSGGAPVPAQIAEVGLFVVSGLLLLTVGDQLQSLTQLKWLTWLMLAAGLITCIVQIVPGLESIGRSTTRPGTVGCMFWTWVVAVSYSQALVNRNLSAPVRLVLLGITALVLYHGLFQIRSWASGWLPPLIAIGVISLFRFPRLTIGLGLVGVPAGLFLLTTLTDFVMDEESTSLSARLDSWTLLWQLVERSPLLGTGPANYYYFTENFSIRGWYVRFVSHNNYQDLLVQTGFLGLLAFFWIALEAGRMMLRLYSRVPAGFARAYVIGALGGLAGSLVAGMLGDWIIGFYYNGGIQGFRSSLLFWLFLGGALAMHKFAANAAGTEPVAAHAAAYSRADRKLQYAYRTS
jgi:hypothetical protein